MATNGKAEMRALVAIVVDGGPGGMLLWFVEIVDTGSPTIFDHRLQGGNAEGQLSWNEEELVVCQWGDSGLAFVWSSPGCWPRLLLLANAPIPI